MTQPAALSVSTLALGVAGGARAALASRPDTDTQHLAWQREMEKAESEAWFKMLKEKAQDNRPVPVVAATSPASSPVLRPSGQLLSGPLASQAATRKAEWAAATPSQGATASRSFAADGPRSESQRPSLEKTPQAGNSHSVSGASARMVEPEASVLRDPGGTGADVLASRLLSVQWPTLSLPSPSQLSSPLRSAVAMSVIQPPAQPSTAAQRSTFAPLVASADRLAPGAVALDVAAGTARAEIAVPSDSRRQLAAALSRAFEPMPGPQFHVEWNEAGSATVWIGVAASEAADLPALVDALSRWISRIGMRLRSVVCNGVSCFESVDRSQPVTAQADGAPADGAPATAHSTPDIDIFIDRED